ncbi:hypothetical protein, variant 1 [Aphanomyces astaci]|uniref:Uncharacterized protein n=1 Tax=Aphanomyces astaci TaxID=112090 RepID=W4GM34_APHAT|nr:hypothetical protein, variant 1 [Aphanomyces astaci]ETV79958.1 hypothetical protein, variant 1 [Aphanomyces astaci]|eukprot:XP_009830894.1 hypothetical protein, variant 1 [Aphanomyces astaci]
MLVLQTSLVAVLTAASGLATAVGPSITLNGWFSCTEETFWHPPSSSNRRRLHEAAAPFGSPPVPDGAQCGQYSVPLCHPGVCNSTDDTIQVFVKRLVGSTSKVLWVLQGGPGASSVNMEPVMIELFHQLNEQVTIMTMDHRGTGRSTRLECVAAQAMESGSPSGRNVNDDELPNCLRDIHTRYGHPEAFSVTSAALDLVAVIELDQRDQEVFLYGVSYGTLWLERFVAVQPPTMTNVHGFVLDGVVPHHGTRRLYMHDWDTNMDSVGREFLALCDADSFCQSQFPPPSSSIAQSMQALYRDTHPSAAYIKDMLDGPYGLKVVLSVLLTHSSLRLLIPVLVHRLHRGTPGDLDVVTYMLDILSDLWTGHDDESLSYDSDLLYSTVVFSELWQHPTPSEASLLNTFVRGLFGYGVVGMFPSYCVYTNDPTPDCDAHRANDVSFTYALDRYANQPVVAPTEASILVLNGGLDPQTPLAYAQAQFDAIQGAKKLIVFPTAPHAITYVTWLQEQQGPPTTCGVLLVTSYVQVGGNLDALDTSCVAKTRPMTFRIPQQLGHVFPLVLDGQLFDGPLATSTTEVAATASPSSLPPQTTLEQPTTLPPSTAATTTTNKEGAGVVLGNTPTAAPLPPPSSSTNMAESMVGLLGCLLVVTGIVAVKYFVEAKRLRRHMPLEEDVA